MNTSAIVVEKPFNLYEYGQSAYIVVDKSGCVILSDTQINKIAERVIELLRKE
jgi:hypothetical protein